MRTAATVALGAALVVAAGGTIGGTIKTDKSFFFFSYQGQRINEDRVRGSNPPTAAVARDGQIQP